MNMMSHSGSVADDGEPSTALAIAHNALRDFNHRTLVSMEVAQPGWRYVPDAYEALGELGGIVGVLPQAVQQVMAAVRRQHDYDLIAMDAGSDYDGHPEAAVDAASVALDRATRAAEQLYQGIKDAQAALSAAHYNKPGPSGPQ